MTTFTKTIQYDRHSRDFAMYLDGELVGFARSYCDAERTLDALVYEILTREAVVSADAEAEAAAAVEEAARPSSLCPGCGHNWCIGACTCDLAVA